MIFFIVHVTKLVMYSSYVPAEGLHGWCFIKCSSYIFNYIYSNPLFIVHFPRAIVYYTQHIKSIPTKLHSSA